jgi:hypothetical protein
MPPLLSGPNSIHSLCTPSPTKRKSAPPAPPTIKRKRVIIAPFASASKPASKPAAKMSEYSVDDLTCEFSGQVIQGYVEQGLSSLQYGGHVNFGNGISVPFLVGGWKEQMDGPNDDFNQIKRKYTII